MPRGRKGQGRVRVTVRDEGKGLTPKDMEKLFDTFYTTRSGGMGVGLAISRSTVESHAGQPRAESNNGPGATLSFFLPALAKVAAAEGPLPGL